jgi:hypothetical protein
VITRVQSSERLTVLNSPQLEYTHVISGMCTFSGSFCCDTRVSSEECPDEGIISGNLQSQVVQPHLQIKAVLVNFAIVQSRKSLRVWRKAKSWPSHHGRHVVKRDSAQWKFDQRHRSETTITTSK